MKNFKKKIQKFSKILLVLILSILISPLNSFAAGGDFVWAKGFGSFSSDYGNYVFLDSSNNVYTTGSFQGTADFDPGVGTHNLTSSDGGGVFILKLDSSGVFLWAKSTGGTGLASASSLIVDSSNNVYITGSFQGTVDFDPGAGTSNLTSAGWGDIFVLKLDSNGDFVWAKKVGGASGDDIGNSIKIDSFGGVYITGYFNGTVDFDPGAGTSNLTSAGGSDIFVLKLDSNGDFVWAKKVGGVFSDQAKSLYLNSSNSLFIVGNFGNTVDFDPGAGTSNLTSVGNDDSFVLKLDSNGDFVWVKSFGGLNNDRSNYVFLDSSSNIYVVGYFSGTSDFDPGAGTSNLTSVGNDDSFVLKLDSNGDFVWAKNIGGNGTDWGYSVVVDSLSNLYITGYFNGTVDFDPGAGTSNLTSAGGSDSFVLKLDSNGDFVWAKKVGGESFNNDEGRSIALDVNNNIYIVGYFAGVVDFDPGTGTSNLTSSGMPGSRDIFVLKLLESNPPTLSETTPIGTSVNNFTPSYTFNTTEAGTITYGGNCSSSTTTATLGSNTITLNALNIGTYNNCTITVTDSNGNQSTPLTISQFAIVVHSGSSSSPSSNTTETTTENTQINTQNNTENTENTQNQNTENTNQTENTTTVSTPNTYISPLDNTERICQPFTTYLRKGNKSNNQEQVKLWQAFLNKYEKENLRIDGILGNNTELAIKRFQAKYKDYILTPWNLNTPTGYTYQTTRAYGNKLLGCSEGEVRLDNGRLINY